MLSNESSAELSAGHPTETHISKETLRQPFLIISRHLSFIFLFICYLVTSGGADFGRFVPSL